MRGSSERIAGFRAAGLVAALEPTRAFSGGSVRPFLRLHGACRLALQTIVPDRRCGLECTVEIPGFEQLALLGRVRPDAGEAVRLQLEAYRCAVLTLHGAARGFVHPIIDVQQMLHMVTDLVRDDVGLS